MLAVDVDVLRRNRLLASVHERELERFVRLLHRRDYASGQILTEPRQPITEIVFPLSSVFSVVAETAEGSQVEAGTIGNEGVVGLPVFLGADSSLLRTMCQIPGEALAADVRELLTRADGALATAARRYALAFMTMASQGAACNRLHSIEQRAARWLLMVADRVDRNPFELTQEFLAIMLGATRPSVTVVAGTLRDAGLISYQRGHVTILDRPGLEKITCECYGIITAEYEEAVGIPLGRDGVTPERRPQPS